MTEDFVTFELAKKLKEKGYPQTPDNMSCMPYYEYDEVINATSLCNEIVYYSAEPRNIFAAPAIHKVLKWLREDKVISVEPYASASGWRVTICRAYHQDRCDAGGGTCLKREVIGYNDGGAFEKYEEAAIAGIEYVIDNLI